jgi:hypothetical protein
MKVVKFLAREIDLEHQFSELLKKKHRPSSHHHHNHAQQRTTQEATATATDSRDSDSDDDSENESDNSFVYDDEKPSEEPAPGVSATTLKLSVSGLPFSAASMGIGLDAPVDDVISPQ